MDELWWVSLLMGFLFPSIIYTFFLRYFLKYHGESTLSKTFAVIATIMLTMLIISSLERYYSFGFFTAPFMLGMVLYAVIIFLHKATPVVSRGFSIISREIREWRAEKRLLKELEKETELEEKEAEEEVKFIKKIRSYINRAVDWLNKGTNSRNIENALINIRNALRYVETAIIYIENLAKLEQEEEKEIVQEEKIEQEEISEERQEEYSLLNLQRLEREEELLNIQEERIGKVLARLERRELSDEKSLYNNLVELKRLLIGLYGHIQKYAKNPMYGSYISRDLNVIARLLRSINTECKDLLRSISEEEQLEKRLERYLEAESRIDKLKIKLARGGYKFRKI